MHGAAELRVGVADQGGEARPGRLLQAERDEFGSPDEVRLALQGSLGARLLSPVDGATHLFTERLDELERAASAAAAWVLAA